MARWHLTWQDVTHQHNDVADNDVTIFFDFFMGWAHSVLMGQAHSAHFSSFSAHFVWLIGLAEKIQKQPMKLFWTKSS